MEDNKKRPQSKEQQEKLGSSEVSSEVESVNLEEEEEERQGIIPEGMDFRKFIGCGG